MVGGRLKSLLRLGRVLLGGAIIGRMVLWRKCMTRKMMRAVRVLLLLPSPSLLDLTLPRLSARTRLIKRLLSELRTSAVLFTAPKISVLRVCNQ